MANTTDLKSFYYLENGTVNTSILDTIKSTKTLDSGLYTIWSDRDFQKGYQTYLEKTEEESNFKMTMVFPYMSKIDEVFLKFFDKDVKDAANSLGYKHKLGILLYGKQGTGKTSILKYYFTKAIKEQEAIVFYISSYECVNETFKFISKIRRIQKNPIIVFMDEVDELFTKYSSETEVKTFMDGQDSIDNCFFMASTNYIEKIPKSVKERPSRFKYCIEAEGIQDEKIIEDFLLKNTENFDINIDITEVSKLKGSTIDELKEYVLDKIMDLKNQKTKAKTIGFK